MADSLEEKIYQEVKTAIFERRLLPGMPIREQEVAAHYLVSRTPVRQALRRLARERLLDIVPNKGTYVAQPTPEEVHQAFVLRNHLEGLAARLAAQHITDAELTTLERLMEEEEAAYLARQPWRALSLGNQIHERIAAAARHPRLKQYIDELIAQSYVYFALYDVVDPACLRAPGEHRRILDALRRRDSRAAETLMLEHMEDQVKHLDVQRRAVPVPPWAQPQQVG